MNFLPMQLQGLLQGLLEEYKLLLGDLLKVVAVVDVTLDAIRQSALASTEKIETILL